MCVYLQLALQHSQSVRQRGMGRVADLLDQSESFAQRSLSTATTTLRLHACYHDDGLLSFSCAGTGGNIMKPYMAFSLIRSGTENLFHKGPVLWNRFPMPGLDKCFSNWVHIENKVLSLADNLVVCTIHQLLLCWYVNI